MGMYFVIVAALFVLLLTALQINQEQIGLIRSANQTSTYRKYGVSKYDRLQNISILLLLFFCFLTAFRSNTIGNDTSNYIDGFLDINKNGVGPQSSFEYGFQILCVFVGLFTKNPNVFIAVCALICYGGIGIYILKFSSNRLLSAVLAFIFCFSIFNNILRQDLAMVVGLYAYECIKKNKNLKAVVLILLAASFHSAALIMFGLFFHKLFRFKFKTVMILLIIIIALAMSGIIYPIMTVIASRYAHYFNGQYAGSGWTAVTVDVVRNVAIYAFLYCTYKGRTDKSTSVMLCNGMFLVLICGLGYFVNLFTRASQYFILPMLAELPNAFYSGKLKHKKLFMFLLCLFGLAYFIAVLLFRPGWNRLYPFQFFWS